MGHANLRRADGEGGVRAQGTDRYALRCRPRGPTTRLRITRTRESCYANTRQHSAVLTAWRAENESSIFVEDREKDGGRLYRSRHRVA